MLEKFDDEIEQKLEPSSINDVFLVIEGVGEKMLKASDMIDQYLHNNKDIVRIDPK